MRRFILSIALALCPAAVWASEPEVVLVELDFDIDGYTRLGRLRAFLDVRPGDRFPNEAALRRAVDRERQDLVNLRAFKKVEYRVERLAGPGQYRVVFRLDEAIAILPLPYASFDSNTGTELGVDLRYRNAFGTLTEWRSNPLVRILSDGSLGEWMVPLNISRFKVGPVILSAGIEQMHDKDQGVDPETEEALFDFDRDITKVRFGLFYQFLPRQLFYFVQPTTTFRYGYRDNIGGGGFVEDRYEVALEQSFSLRDINWRSNNLRSGRRLGFGHKLSFVSREGDLAVVNTLNPFYREYWIFADWLGYYFRLEGLYAFNGVNESQGQALRGILDRTMTGNAVAFLNQTLSLKIARFKGAVDIQLHPFVDVGAAQQPGRNLLDAQPRLGVGADLFLVLEFLGGFVLRTTVGYDAGRGDRGDVEVLVTIGPFY